MSTFNLSRSASLFETGSGAAWVPGQQPGPSRVRSHDRPAARQRIPISAATQLSGRYLYPPITQPLTKKGNAEVGEISMTNHLWLIPARALHQGIRGLFYPRMNPSATARHPVPENPSFTISKTSIAYTMAKRGPHGLPLNRGTRTGNDCLNLNCFSTGSRTSRLDRPVTWPVPRRVGDDRRALPLTPPASLARFTGRWAGESDAAATSMRG